MHTIASYKDIFRSTIFFLIHLSIFLFSNQIFVHTKNASKKLKDVMAFNRPIKVIQLPIPIRKEKKYKIGKKKRILSFGFITSDKGIDLLCKAAPLLRDFEIVISGTLNPYAQEKQKEFLESIKDYDKRNVNIKFINRFVSEKEKEELFISSDFVVLPYRIIEQSAVLTEVWSYQKIPICSDVPSFREEIGKDQFGVLFESENPVNLATKIKSLAKNEKKQKIIISNIKKLISKRNFSKIADKYISEIKKI
jgi:glycosyltransferase involved in cell wall biosynthesis